MKTKMSKIWFKTKFGSNKMAGWINVCWSVFELNLIRNEYMSLIVNLKYLHQIEIKFMLQKMERARETVRLGELPFLMPRSWSYRLDLI